MAVDRKIPRVQEIVLPLLREHLPDVMITSWIPDPDDRSFPLLNVRRLGGPSVEPDLLDRPVIEVNAYSRDGLVATEDLYLDARSVLFRAVRNQTVTPAGSLSSFREPVGPTPVDSPFDDTWRVQGLIRLGVRPPKR